MKKSVSAPTLAGMGCSTSSSGMRRNVSCNVFPPPVPVVVDFVQKELEAEAVLHVTTQQALSCALTTHKFPKDLLHDGAGGKDLVECLLEPSVENEDLNSSANILINNFLQKTQQVGHYHERGSERFFSILRSVRKRRKNSLQSGKEEQ